MENNRSTKGFYSVIILLLIAVVGLQAYYLFKMNQRIDTLIRSEVETARAAVAASQGSPTRLLPMPSSQSQNLPSGRQHGRDVWGALDRMENYLNQMLDKHVNAFVDRFLSDEGIDAGPQLGMREEDGSYEMQMFIPNLDEKELTVKVEGQTLVVSGQQESAFEQKNAQGSIIKSEHYSNYFKRQYPIPADAKPDTLKTSYKNGLLIIRLEKTQPEKKA